MVVLIQSIKTNHLNTGEQFVQYSSVSGIQMYGVQIPNKPFISDGGILHDSNKSVVSRISGNNNSNTFDNDNNYSNIWNNNNNINAGTYTRNPITH